MVFPCPNYTAELTKLKELEKEHKLDDKVGKPRLKQLKRLAADLLNFKTEAFGDCLPVKFLVADKKVKELAEVRVDFMLTAPSTWIKDIWPQVKIVKIYKD